MPNEHSNFKYLKNRFIQDLYTSKLHKLLNNYGFFKSLNLPISIVQTRNL